MNDTTRVLLGGMLFVVALSLAIGTWVTQSYFEAQSYNHVTGQNVSTWDAMWIELRVQSEPKSHPGSP
jgi:hypothetical protein